MYYVIWTFSLTLSLIGDIFMGMASSDREVTGTSKFYVGILFHMASLFLGFPVFLIKNALDQTLTKQFTFFTTAGFVLTIVLPTYFIVSELIFSGYV